MECVDGGGVILQACAAVLDLEDLIMVLSIDAKNSCRSLMPLLEHTFIGDANVPLRQGMTKIYPHILF